jgi:hypothetical protein
LLTLFIDTGYAFSGEAGHNPEILERLQKATAKLIAAQRILSTMPSKRV